MIMALDNVRLQLSENSLKGTTQLRPSGISDVENYEHYKVVVFKVLNSGVIYYMAIDNRNTTLM